MTTEDERRRTNGYRSSFVLRLSSECLQERVVLDRIHQVFEFADVANAHTNHPALTVRVGVDQFGLVNQLLLTSITSPLTGENKSDAALTDSTTPNTLNCSTCLPFAPRSTYTTSPSACSRIASIRRGGCLPRQGRPIIGSVAEVSTAAERRGAPHSPRVSPGPPDSLRPQRPSAWLRLAPLPPHPTPPLPYSRAAVTPAGPW